MKLSDIYIRDPFIFAEDGTYYLVGSTDKNPFNEGKSFLGYKSNDLINFEGPFLLFENDGTFWSDMHYWAPELYKIDGKYCLFASFYKKGKHRVTQVLICETPLGRYVPTAKPYTPSEFDCLDGTYYYENGHRYSVFCREWTQIHDGEMCVGELNDDLTEISNVKTIFKASDAKWTSPFKLSIDGVDNYVTDGPFIYKTEGGRLIMLWSSNSKTGYATGIAYSDSGIYGEWIHLDEPLYSKDGGHAMIFTANNKKYIIMHINNSVPGSERPAIFEIKEDNNMIYLLDKED